MKKIRKIEQQIQIQQIHTVMCVSLLSKGMQEAHGRDKSTINL